MPWKSTTTVVLQSGLSAWIGASGWILGQKYYEYDNVYITAFPDKAFGYRRRSFVFGELGYFAHYLDYGAEEFGFDLSDADDYQRQALSYIRNRTIEDSDPVVLMIFSFLAALLQLLSLHQRRCCLHFKHRLIQKLLLVFF